VGAWFADKGSFHPENFVEKSFKTKKLGSAFFLVLREQQHWW
jgi:hypothetical protein